MTYNKITVAFGALRKITGPALQWQYNEKQILVINGLDLPNSYAVDFCNKGDTDTVTMPATAEGVEIPDQFLLTGRPLTAYIVVVDGESVNTIGEITFPVNVRGRRTDISPEPVEQQQIDALIEALNDGVERAEDAAELLENCSAEAETLSPGSQATAEYANGVFSFGIPQGQRGETGPRGETGERGEKGDTGDTGPQGPKGDKLTYADLTEADKADLVQGPILEAQTEAVQAVNTAGDTQTERVNQAGTTQTNAVNQAGTTQVAAVNQAGVAQVAAVEAEGTEQVGAVRAKGAEVLESIPDDYTELQHHVDAVTIYETASGDIASFEDGADDLPIKKLVANIEPQQDLNGYDYPWPPGGGKNLLGNINPTVGKASYVAFWGNRSAQTATDGISLKAGTYTLSFNNPSNLRIGVYGCWLDEKTQFTLLANGTSNPRIATFSTDTDRVLNFWLYFGDGNASTDGMTFQIESGSTATSYSPYSNICPIEGWDGLTGKRTGKNLLKLSESVETNKQKINIEYTEDGAVLSAAGTYAQVSYRLKLLTVGKTYTISFYGQSDGDYRRVYLLNKETGFEYGIGFLLTATRTKYTRTFTATSEWLLIAPYITTGSQQTGTMTIEELQIEESSVATDYAPYQAEDISVDFPATVYGGTLDVVTGELTVDRAGVEFDGSDDENWQYYSVAQGNLFRKVGELNPRISTETIGQFLCSEYRPAVSRTNGTISGSIQGYIDFINNAITDLASWKTDLSQRPVQVVYPLTTPLTYQLTPQQVTSLLGENRVWADTGNVEVTYPADTKLFIEKLTQPTEDDMVANANIAANKFFMIGNALYYSTAAIAQGETIIPGTNCNAVSLADALNTLNA